MKIIMKIKIKMKATKKRNLLIYLQACLGVTFQNGEIPEGTPARSDFINKSAGLEICTKAMISYRIRKKMVMPFNMHESSKT